MAIIKLAMARASKGTREYFISLFALMFVCKILLSIHVVNFQC